MSRILGMFFGILLMMLGLLIICEDEITTRDKIIENKNSTIIFHKNVEKKKISETIDQNYKNKYNLRYY